MIGLWFFASLVLIKLFWLRRVSLTFHCKVREEEAREEKKFSINPIVGLMHVVHCRQQRLLKWFGSWMVPIKSGAWERKGSDDGSNRRIFPANLAASLPTTWIIQSLPPTHIFINRASHELVVYCQQPISLMHDDAKSFHMFGQIHACSTILKFLIWQLLPVPLWWVPAGSK